ncbi:hypothetical protein ABIB48_002649 [Arthrobacter sp. UYCu511]|uniref:hypothetical protein n=1 Tax=Arthrobacter sp. UYCu511 TaxID=3156337 RepID=UPI0033966236
MSERAEHKAWAAMALHAAQFAAEHGGDSMSPDDQLTYEGLMQDVQASAERHDSVRDETGS